MQNLSADDLHRTTVYDRNGDKVGKVQQVYLDDDSGRPSWVTVNTGLFGTNESLIPLDGAQVDDDIVKVPFDKQVIKDAPNFDPGHHLDESDENTLYDYYGVGRHSDDDGTFANHGDQRSEDRGVAQDRLRDQDRGPGQDPVREQASDRGDTARAATAGGVGGLAAAAAAGQHSRDDRGTDLRDERGTSLRDDRRTDLRDERSDERELRSGGDTTFDADRESSRGDQAGAAFTQGSGDSRGSGLGDSERAGVADSGQEPDDHERQLLERERELLQRERDLLDKDRQFMERERQHGGRPRLRRHDPGER